MADSADRPPPRPRWVKVSVIIVVALVAIFLILKATGVGGEHGPGRHGPGRHHGLGLDHGVRQLL